MTTATLERATCKCGCGQAPGTARAEYVRGHNSKQPIAQVIRCKGQGEYRHVAGCGEPIKRSSVAAQQGSGLCRPCYLAASTVTYTCAYVEPGGEPHTFQRQRSRHAESERHFCTHAHSLAWKQGRTRVLRPKGTVSGWRARNLKKAREQPPPSYASIARDAALDRHTVTAAAQGKRKGHAWGYTRYRMEQAGLLERSTWPPLTETIYAWCLAQGMAEIGDLARAAKMDVKILSKVLQRGGARPATLQQIAAAIGKTGDELEALCDPNRHRKTHIRKTRKPGRPRKVTDAQARKAWRLHEEGKTTAEIGQLMGWPVKNRECLTARRAIKRGETLCLPSKSECRQNSSTAEILDKPERNRAH